MTGSPQQASIHFTELPGPGAGSSLVKEWNCYRREVERLLSEGNEGRWVLIHGDDVLGVWPLQGDAEAERSRRFENRCGLVKQILEWEPIVRGGGYFHRWAG